MSEKEYFIELHLKEIKELHLKEINKKLNRIDKRLDKLEEHINFINSVYSDLKNPINIAKKFFK